MKAENIISFMSKRLAYVIYLYFSLFSVNLTAQYANPQLNSSFYADQNVVYNGSIVIPYQFGQVGVFNNSTIDLKSSESILLLDGFDADASNGCASLFAYIDPTLIAAVQPSDLNFIYMKSPNVPKQTIGDVDVLDIRNKQLSVNYFDGISNPLQNISIQSTSDVNGTDVVQPITYDASGRSLKSYLPFASTAATGEYHSNSVSEQSSFYQTNNFGIVQSQLAFSQALTDNSPLNRILQQKYEGSDWYDHPTSFIYESNSYNQVPLFAIGSTGVYKNGYYNMSELTHTIVADENCDLNSVNTYIGNVVEEFKNKNGQTICKRSWARNDNGHTYDFTLGQQDNQFASLTREYFCTFYIYNDLGQLVYVVPPLAYQEMVTANDYTFSEAGSPIFDKYIYAYHYDTRGRLIEKKIPGKEGWDWICYNILDMPIMNSDPDQHCNGKNEWNFTKYDVYKRAIITGLYDGSNLPANANMRAYVQSLIDAVGDFWEQKDLSTSTGYTNLTFPQGSILPQVIYYFDNYEFPNDPILLSRNYINYPANVKSDKSVGLLTATKTFAVDYGIYLHKLFYYDEKGQTIQVQSENHIGGWDIVNNEYSFTGLVKKSKREHSSNTVSNLTITTRLEYDHENRLMDVFKQVNTDPEVHLVQNEYNLIGQLISKKLHVDPNLSDGFLQKIDYRYNERGWLKSINNSALVDDQGLSNTDSHDAFGEEIFYQDCNMDMDHTDPTKSFYTIPQYNGNISEVKWKNKAPNVDPFDISEKAYAYRYDEMNRMTAGYYAAASNGFGDWFDSEKMFYNEKYHYDANGNILNCDRNNKFDNSNSVPIDNLTYFYNGNKLMSIDDGVAQSGYGFTDVQNGNDYNYDPNGNLVSDKNKDITTISYNQLKLPTFISITNGNHSLDFYYDAAGRKLAKRVDSQNIKQYCDGIEYGPNGLDFILTEEGRIRPKSAGATNSEAYVYDYFLKDHLGSVRSVVTNEKIDNQAIATMENVNAAVEEQLFYNVAETREALPAGYPFDGSYQPNLFVSNVNAAEGKQNGPSRAMEINAGDNISIDVKYFYTQFISPNNNPSTSNILAQLANVFFLNPALNSTIAGSDLPTRNQWATSSFTTNSSANTFISDFINSTANSSSTNPHAYLTYLVYDKEFNLIPSVSGIARVSVPNVLGDLSVSDLVIPKDGYLYVYLSNESGVEVYFDNLHILNSKSSLLSSSDYYPYGGEIQCASQSSSIPNNYKFNKGSELVDNLGVQIYLTNFREYDPWGRIGWLQIDPKTESQESWSPYHYVFDNPIRYSDPKGDCPPGTPCDPLVNSLVSGAVAHPDGVSAHALGVINGLGNSINGLVDAVVNFDQTVKGLGNLALAGFAGNPLSALQNDAALGTNSFGTMVGLAQNASSGVNDLLHGNGMQRGTVLGGMLGLYLGNKGISAGLGYFGSETTVAEVSNASTKLLNQFNSAESLIEGAGKLNHIKGAMQGFVKGDIDAIFKSITQGGKTLPKGSIQLENGNIITKYSSSTTGETSIQINKAGKIFKIRINK